MNDHRQPKGIPTGGQFAEHDRADADVALGGAQPMPELMSKIVYRGARHTVVHVDDRTAAIQRPNGDVLLVSDKDLGLDKPAAPVLLPETLRRRRGHDFYPGDIRTWPPLGTHDSTPLAEIPIVARYFSPNVDWYIAEVDADTGKAWGYARISHMPENAEWGYISLVELEQLYPSPLYIVERDCYFTPGPAGEVIEK